ncbi:hypothetical protein BC939DRAFT_434272 [Gamsiella multidivaricata]|uniref:uncharacterized protein n=1 Tax=Gamsiella multidivaricata TaxID=101098 RepID=UPI00221E8A64|nr:uncharacterized protein BC939DRAFT_434272 [Gamsiella multidivaricata]KAI7832751.1 hypothetical protein BC939DRAFT_434272 [Gamsiella multidivaricata]
MGKAGAIRRTIGWALMSGWISGCDAKCEHVGALRNCPNAYICGNKERVRERNVYISSCMHQLQTPYESLSFIFL